MLVMKEGNGQAIGREKRAVKGNLSVVQKEELGIIYRWMYLPPELSTFVNRLELLFFLVLRRGSCLTAQSNKGCVPWSCCMSGMSGMR